MSLPRLLTPAAALFACGVQLSPAQAIPLASPLSTPKAELAVVVHITDLGTGKPLRGVTVKIQDSRSTRPVVTGATDRSGNFKAKLPAGGYQLQYSRDGYLRMPECTPLPYPQCMPWHVSETSQVDGELFRQDATLSYFARATKAAVASRAANDQLHALAERIHASVLRSAGQNETKASTLYAKVWRGLAGTSSAGRKQFAQELSATAPQQYQDVVRSLLGSVEPLVQPGAEATSLTSGALPLDPEYGPLLPEIRDRDTPIPSGHSAFASVSGCRRMERVVDCSLLVENRRPPRGFEIRNARMIDSEGSHHVAMSPPAADDWKRYLGDGETATFHVRFQVSGAPSRITILTIDGWIWRLPTERAPFSLTFRDTELGTP